MFNSYLKNMPLNIILYKILQIYTLKSFILTKIIKFKNIFVSAVKHFVLTVIMIPMIPVIPIINSCFGKNFEAINFSKILIIKVLRKSSTANKNIWCHDGRNDDDCVGSEFKGLFVSAVRKFI